MLNKKNIKISIIIPVYNCENDLSQCLDSVRKQTIDNIEIICIDDGSTDNSFSIAEQYANVDKRIRLFRQENQGAAVARNRGVKAAKGKYIAFLDADDFYLDKNALDKMYLLCEKNEVPVCGSFRKNLEECVFKDTYIIENEKEYAEQGTILEYSNFQFDYEYQNFIFLKKVIEENMIEFPDYRRYEDPPFLVRVMYAAQKFVIANTYLYCYRVPNQIQRSDTEKTVDVLSGIISNLDFATEHNLDILFDRTVKHIDFERRYLITHDITENSIGIIEKLIEANQMIREYTGNSGYIVNPLKDIMKGFLYQRDDYENHLKKMFDQNTNIIVYGAGSIAQIFLDYLSEKNMMQNVSYIMVSSEVKENTEFRGILMVSLKNKKMCSRIKDNYVCIATTGAYHNEIEISLQKNGFTRFEALNDAFLLEYANYKNEG